MTLHVGHANEGVLLANTPERRIPLLPMPGISISPGTQEAAMHEMR